MALARSSSSPDRQHGFSLIEVMVASLILTTGVLALAQLFTLSTTSNVSSRHTTYTTVLAEQKMEELRALTWGFDTAGLPVSDTGSDTASAGDATSGGTGLSPSPATSLQANTDGWVDYVDQFGRKLGGGAEPPPGAVYARRWSVEPLPTNPNNTLILQVLAFRVRDRGAADDGSVARMPDEARLATVKTRKAR